MSKIDGKPAATFTEGPIFMKMLKFTLPILATALLQTLYNASDMIVVGNFSSNGSFAMGAVGACGSLISLCINLFVGLSAGVGICVAQNIGAGRYDDVKKYIHTSALLSLICGIVLGIFGFCSAGALLRLMGTPENLLVEAVPYMKAYFVGMPAMLVYNFLASALRSSGDSKRPLIFLTISGLANVIINLIMIIGFGMGAVGVGIATTVAQYLSAIMIIFYMLRTNGICRLEPKSLRIHKQMVIGIMQNGVPVGLQSVVFAISNVLIQSSVNTFGDVTVTGASAASNIEGFVYVAMNAMAQAVMTIVSQNVGAGKYERIKRIMLLAIIMVTVIGGTMSILVNLFAQPLLSIYEPGNEPVHIAIREAGASKLLIVCLPYFLCGIMECISNALKGMGRAIASMAISIFGSCVLRIVWIYAVCPFLPRKIEMLYLAYPITWTVTIIGLAVCIIIAYKSLIKRRDARIADASAPTNA